MFNGLLVIPFILLLGVSSLHAQDERKPDSEWATFDSSLVPDNLTIPSFLEGKKFRVRSVNNAWFVSLSRMLQDWGEEVSDADKWDHFNTLVEIENWPYLFRKPEIYITAKHAQTMLDNEQPKDLYHFVFITAALGFEDIDNSKKKTIVVTAQTRRTIKLVLPQSMDIEDIKKLKLTSETAATLNDAVRAVFGIKGSKADQTIELTMDSFKKVDEDR